MQHGSLIRIIRKHGPDVWQFRWSETGGNGNVCHRDGEQHSDAVEARRFAAGILAMPSPADLPTKPVAMTIAELCQHFQHRELARDDNWRSYSTRRNYEFNLRKWIIPRWAYELGEVRAIEVESWLRGLPLARSSCAKSRNPMSVLFNHAWRHELFDRNPIKLVRQSAKRRAALNVLALLKSSSYWIIWISGNEHWFWWQPQPAYAKVSCLRSSGETSIFPRAG